jgi:hypothetical protein
MASAREELFGMVKQMLNLKSQMPFFPSTRASADDEKVRLFAKRFRLLLTGQNEEQTPVEPSVSSIVLETVESGRPDPSERPSEETPVRTECRAPGCSSELSSTADDTPLINTDISTIEELRSQQYWEEVRKSFGCNSQTAAGLRGNNSREAYNQYKKGMLRTGESEYSILLTEYFNDCFAKFGAQEDVENSYSKSNLYISKHIEIVILPKYYFMRIALYEVIRELKQAGRISDAAEFQKEAIFLIMLEGTENDCFGAQGDEDHYLRLERRISNNIQELRKLKGTRMQRRTCV